MALYAFAFGAYLISLFGSTDQIYRAIVSIALIFILAGVNLLGIRESGITEDILVILRQLFYCL